MTMHRYNVVQLRGTYYVNDPDTMTLAPFDRWAVAEYTSRQLNRGMFDRDALVWISYCS